MALTGTQESLLHSHINAKWKTKQCYLCGGNNWSMYGVVNIALSDLNALPSNTPSLPTAAVVCGTCGHTVLVNLVMAGILPPIHRAY